MRISPILILAIGACSSKSPAPVGPGTGSGSGSGSGIAPEDAAVAVTPPPAPNTCTEPAPGPDYTCVQACGPPVVRQGDPPPTWSWLSPAEVESRNKYGCPRCLAGTTQIATPDGPRALADFAIGDPILTVDAHGARIPARVIHVGSTLASKEHHLVRLALADGRVVAGSAGHPDASGRPLSAISVGDQLDGARVVSVGDVLLSGDRTWDVLPSGATGLYIADDVVLRSTFFRGP